MQWIKNIFRDRQESEYSLKSLREKFSYFLFLLDKNNQVLKLMGDMEEKAQGEYLFDLNYIRSSLDRARADVLDIIDNMIKMGGSEYETLLPVFARIDREINNILPGMRPIEEDDFVIPFSELGSDRAWSVGSKSAQLGEMKGMGLPVPDGFAVSAWAYKHFIDSNGLQSRISRKLSTVDLKSPAELVRVSKEIREMIVGNPVPDDLADAIREAHGSLLKRAHSKRVAMRSSAIGEDTQLSFAGQYETFLNVGADEVVDRYRQVLASKYSPKALYYLLSHGLSESQLAMAVACVAMVDSRVSGVIYTRDPVHPKSDCVVINSVFGLGQYLVDGTLSPDEFCVSRVGKHISSSFISKKPVRLVTCPGGGTVEEAVGPSKQEAASLTEDQLTRLAELALEIEEHYGASRDIEWAIDGEGRVFLLQSRPLRVIDFNADESTEETPEVEPLLKGGTTVCPGAGGGPVCHARSMRDLARVPEGSVLVAPHPFPGLITAFSRVVALVTEVGGVASHAATIAREYRVPTLAGVAGIECLQDGQEVTVDATGMSIYPGVHPDFIKSRRPEFELFDDMAIFDILKRILAKVSHLNLINTSAGDFISDGCATFHDITRFCHQRAMEEMFKSATNLRDKSRHAARLKSDIPLQVNIIFIDEGPEDRKSGQWLEVDDLGSEPMRALWKGIEKEGWPQRMPRADVRGFMAVMSANMDAGAKPEFSESSFAILGRDYMLLSLRMGYHFTTVEAITAPETSKNYIHMQYKEGGAPLERRSRRIRILTELLNRLGFESHSQADFLDSMITYVPREAALEKLSLLGRINLMTKQLDMALGNDAIAQWYLEDFIKKLGLDHGGQSG